MANLKVLMMGGRRCGKTSALASLFHQMINSKPIMELLSASDQTILEVKTRPDGTEEKQEALHNKKYELVSFLRKYNVSNFLVDIGPTSNYWLYKLQIALTGTNKRMVMEFRDSAGEFFDHGGKHSLETLNYVKECDVYIVVVDTPYLMNDDDAVVNAANVTDSIHSFLTSMDESGSSQNAKCVLFVPIKCEKWIHEGRINEVNERIKEVYASSIKHLMNRPNTELSIIPIETAGDIEFSEMRDPYVLVCKDKDGRDVMRKCAKVTEKTVVLSDGTPASVKSTEVVLEDPQGVFTFDDESLDIVRPAAWYRHPTTKPKYSPKNCEQIALHVLRFMLNKARNSQNGNWFTQTFRAIFGQITINDLNNTLVAMTNQNLIKDSGDGIERLKIYK